MMATLLQEELFESSAKPLDAMAYLAMAPAASRGAVHTRPVVADFILNLVGWTSGSDLLQARLLEPSAGEGDFLIPAAVRLLAVVQANEGMKIRACIRAVEVGTEALARCRERLLELFLSHGWRLDCAEEVVDEWLIHGDFLTVPIARGFTHIVGNPPYVRLEHLPKQLLALYRSRWTSLFDRADLYVAFIERSLDLLAPEGRLGFICADRWMKNRYGGPLRSKVADGYSLDTYVDFTGCPAFFDSVDAYPAVFVVRRGAGDSTRVAFRPEISESSLITLASDMRSGGAGGRCSEVRGAVRGDQPWMFDEDGTGTVLRHLEERFPLLEACGCRVGIGVATGADGIFIGRDEELDVESNRRLPLITTRDIRDGQVRWGGLWVLNPFEDCGKLADLKEYPRFAEYVNRHRDAISRRNVAARNPGGWYRTIDRIHPELTSKPKLLIPDIKGDAHVVFEGGHYYPHHNLYYVVSETWDLHALRVILSSRVARAFVAAYCPKLRGGFLRFQAQYLRRIRLPDWGRLSPDLRLALVRQGQEAARDPREELVRAAYELGSSEWESLQPLKVQS